jgi:hypothetical protein
MKSKRAVDKVGILTPRFGWLLNAKNRGLLIIYMVRHQRIGSGMITNFQLLEIFSEPRTWNLEAGVREL